MKQSNLDEDNYPLDRWSHLNRYEKKYLQKAIKAYDEIMENKDDIKIITNRYQVNINDVKRAKNYAFGNGVQINKFTPDILMTEAWQRMTSRQEIDTDQVLLNHEIMESDLVINQRINQLEAHNITQKKFPWSMLIMQKENQL
jgi:hypothetical protein